MKYATLKILMMRYHVFFALFILFNVAPGKGQNVVTDSTATVVSYWEKGDNMKYSLLQKKEKYKDGKLSSTGSSISNVTISILEATEKSYTLSWKYDQIKLNDTVAIDALSQKLIRLTEGIDFRYKTSEVGEFQELLNWEDVRNSVFLLIDQLGQLSKHPDMKTALNETKKIFSSKESIEELILRDVQLLHTLYGREYKLHESIKGETEVPNFLGGNPFSAVLSIEMTELNPSKDHCKIQMIQVLDKERLTKELNDWIEKLGKPKDSRLPLINMVDEYNFEIELKKGIIRKAISMRAVEIDNTKSIEIHELIKID